MTGPRADGTAAALCRRLVRSAVRASLATTAEKGKAGVDGPWAFASLVLAACDFDASPLLLISDLADHTRNLKADPRVALLYDGTGGLSEPLSGPRLTLQGRAEPTDEARLLDRYVRRHPSAATYAGFGDFHLYRVRPVRGHLVAGFGRIEWLTAPDLRLDQRLCQAFAEHEAATLTRWNDRHGDLLDRAAGTLLKRRGKRWRAVGLDPEGVDLRRGDALVRIEFDAPARDPDAALAALRERLGTTAGA